MTTTIATTVEHDGPRTHYTDANGRTTTIDRSGPNPTAYLPGGKVLVGPAAVDRLERDLAADTGEPDPAAERRQAEQARREQEQADAAQRLPELQAAEADAKADRDRAHDEFVQAVASDPVLAAFRAFRASEDAYTEARKRARQTKGKAEGREVSGGGKPSPRLLDALRDALDEPKPVSPDAAEFHANPRDP